jgi:hypothetical protein
MNPFVRFKDNAATTCMALNRLFVIEYVSYSSKNGSAPFYLTVYPI